MGYIVIPKATTKKITQKNILKVTRGVKMVGRKYPSNTKESNNGRTEK